MERTPARSPGGRLGADHLPVRRGVSAADFTRARSTPTGSERDRVFRRLKTCGHFGTPAATSENSRPLSRGHGVETKAPKTPPRTAPSWMPPAVSRLRHILPVTGSSAPGAALSLGQASFAIRFTQVWRLSLFSRSQPTRSSCRCVRSWVLPGNQGKIGGSPNRCNGQIDVEQRPVQMVGGLPLND